MIKLQENINNRAEAVNFQNEWINPTDTGSVQTSQDGHCPDKPNPKDFYKPANNCLNKCPSAEKLLAEVTCPNTGKTRKLQLLVYSEI